MSEKKRKVFSSSFKAKVAIDALREQKTVNQLAQDHGIHASQIGVWKKELLAKSAAVFDTARGPKPSETDDLEKLYAQIGRLKVEVDWLKKKLGMNLS
jgi:transposase